MSVWISTVKYEDANMGGRAFAEWLADTFDTVYGKADHIFITKEGLKRIDEKDEILYPKQIEELYDLVMKNGDSVELAISW